MKVKIIDTESKLDLIINGVTLASANKNRKQNTILEICRYGIEKESFIEASFSLSKGSEDSLVKLIDSLKPKMVIIER